MRFLGIILLWICLLPMQLWSQAIYRTGSQHPVNTRHSAGVVLAGGATDNDDAMRWMLRRAEGGDVVVLRAGGSDGYNNYFYSGLGVNVNSVTSVVIGSAAHANSEQVLDIVREAEVVFIAGGNQWNYVNYWRGTRLQELLNTLINEKQITIGGTSAGMAVLGEVVFTAENNTIWTSEALEDPFHWRMTLEKEFLQVPFMRYTVTDTHYNRVQNDDLDRQGRHIAFLARMVHDWQMPARGIASNEFTAVAVDERGIAQVFGNPNRQDYAYFLQAYGGEAEKCVAGQPLHWSQDGKAVKVYKVKGDRQGSNWFDLRDWVNGEGGEWEFWHVSNGSLIRDPAHLSGRWLRFEARDARDSTLLQGAWVGLADSESALPPKAGDPLRAGHTAGSGSTGSDDPGKSHSPQQTSVFGMASFEDLNPSLSYGYGVSKEGFFTWDGTVAPGNDNLAITAYLQPDDTSTRERDTGTPLKQPNLHTYPNPATDMLWVRLPEAFSWDNQTSIGADRLQLRVFAADGRLLETHRLTVSAAMGASAVNVGHLPAGVYLLEMGDGMSRMAGRFVKGVH